MSLLLNRQKLAQIYSSVFKKFKGRQLLNKLTNIKKHLLLLPVLLILLIIIFRDINLFSTNLYTGTDAAGLIYFYKIIQSKKIFWQNYWDLGGIPPLVMNPLLYAIGTPFILLGIHPVIVAKLTLVILAILAFINMYILAYKYSRNILIANISASTYLISSQFLYQLSEGHSLILFSYAVFPIVFLIFINLLKQKYNFIKACILNYFMFTLLFNFHPNYVIIYGVGIGLYYILYWATHLMGKNFNYKFLLGFLLIILYLTSIEFPPIFLALILVLYLIIYVLYTKTHINSEEFKRFIYTSTIFSLGFILGLIPKILIYLSSIEIVPYRGKPIADEYRINALNINQAIWGNSTEIANYIMYYVQKLKTNSYHYIRGILQPSINQNLLLQTIYILAILAIISFIIKLLKNKLKNKKSTQNYSHIYYIIFPILTFSILASTGINNIFSPIYKYIINKLPIMWGIRVLERWGGLTVFLELFIFLELSKQKNIRKIFVVYSLFILFIINVISSYLYLITPIKEAVVKPAEQKILHMLKQDSDYFYVSNSPAGNPYWIEPKYIRRSIPQASFVYTNKPIIEGLGAYGLGRSLLPYIAKEQNRLGNINLPKYQALLNIKYYIDYGYTKYKDNLSLNYPTEGNYLISKFNGIKQVYSQNGIGLYKNQFYDKRNFIKNNIYPVIVIGGLRDVNFIVDTDANLLPILYTDLLQENLLIQTLDKNFPIISNANLENTTKDLAYAICTENKNLKKFILDVNYDYLTDKKIIHDLAIDKSFNEHDSGNNVFGLESIILQPRLVKDIKIPKGFKNSILLIRYKPTGPKSKINIIFTNGTKYSITAVNYVGKSQYNISPNFTWSQLDIKNQHKIRLSIPDSAQPMIIDKIVFILNTTYKECLERSQKYLSKNLIGFIDKYSNFAYENNIYFHLTGTAGLYNAQGSFQDYNSKSDIVLKQNINANSTITVYSKYKFFDNQPKPKDFSNIPIATKLLGTVNNFIKPNLKTIVYETTNFNYWYINKKVKPKITVKNNKIIVSINPKQLKYKNAYIELYLPIARTWTDLYKDGTIQYKAQITLYNLNNIAKALGVVGMNNNFKHDFAWINLQKITNSDSTGNIYEGTFRFTPMQKKMSKIYPIPFLIIPGQIKNSQKNINIEISIQKYKYNNFAIQSNNKLNENIFIENYIGKTLANTVTVPFYSNIIYDYLLYYNKDTLKNFTTYNINIYPVTYHPALKHQKGYWFPCIGGLACSLNFNKLPKKHNFKQVLSIYNTISAYPKYSILINVFVLFLPLIYRLYYAHTNNKQRSPTNR